MYLLLSSKRQDAIPGDPQLVPKTAICLILSKKMSWPTAHYHQRCALDTRYFMWVISTKRRRQRENNNGTQNGIRTSHNSMLHFLCPEYRDCAFRELRSIVFVRQLFFLDQLFMKLFSNGTFPGSRTNFFISKLIQHKGCLWQETKGRRMWNNFSYIGTKRSHHQIIHGSVWTIWLTGKENVSSNQTTLLRF